MAQHVKVLAAKPKDLISTHSTEPKEKDSCQVVLTSTHMSSFPHKWIHKSFKST